MLHWIVLSILHLLGKQFGYNNKHNDDYYSNNNKGDGDEDEGEDAFAYAYFVTKMIKNVQPWEGEGYILLFHISQFLAIRK